MRHGDWTHTSNYGNVFGNNKGELSNYGKTIIQTFIKQNTVNILTKEINIIFLGN